MDKLDIIVPVRNEEKNVRLLVKRIHAALKSSEISYGLIFIDDNSEDKTVRILSRLQARYPIKIYSKIGKRGKAYSILEGAKYSTSENLAMLDADLQYPPEVIPEMFKLLDDHGVVIARRKTYKVPFIRKFLSKSFRLIFGKLLFNLDYDIQSGLKLFKREIIGHIKKEDVSAWTIDLPLLFTAKELGHKISEVSVDFFPRTAGSSNISLFSSILEIGSRALLLRIRKREVFQILPDNVQNMKGSGLIHKGNRFITHTNLDHKVSAFKTLNYWQKILIYFILTSFLFGIIVNIMLTLSITLAILSFIYFIDVLFNLYLILKSLHFPPEINLSDSDLESLEDKDLPVYSILCPLYREARVIPHFIESIQKLDYPKNKLDVQLLLEEDDSQTSDALKKLNLPSYVRINIVPHSLPKTKPKACNFGLNDAKGEYLVIYDAEDEPEPLQLKKAFLAFQKVKDDVVCLQAKLNYYNPNQNLLTRFFTAEYSLWFDVILPGLQTIETNIPLGGTSNHFKTKTLLSLKGWDPFNVTEDCDLGIRLFTRGKKTAIINSTTLEEANSNFKNWLRQRSRWIKGYMQTFLVHTRNPYKLFKQEGIHALIFQMTVGGKIAFLFINPILWAATIAYFTFYSIFGPTIESLYSPTVFYMALFSAVFGNFLYLYYYMIGCAKRGHYSVIKYVYFVPIYWLMGSISAFIALYQLIFKPHFWEKTIHGLNLDKKEDLITETVIELEKEKGFILPNFIKKRLGFELSKKHFIGAMFILGNVVGSFFNFLYSSYLGRVLSFEDFAIVGLINGLFSLFSIVFGALGTTVNYRAGYLMGKEGEIVANSFWRNTRRMAVNISIVLFALWIFLSPLLLSYFNLSNLTPLLLFSPILLVVLAAASDKGLLYSKLNFTVLSILTVAEPLLKLLIAAFLVLFGFGSLAYSAIPLSVVIVFFLGWAFVYKSKSKNSETEVKNFPSGFFSVSLISGLSSIIFLNLDVILAKHYLSPQDAGLYTLAALIGKMVFFFGSFASPFIVPLVSRNEGVNLDSKRVLNFSLLGTLALSLPPFLAIALFGNTLIPFLFGPKSIVTLPFLTLISFSMVCFTLSRVFTVYYLAKKYYSFAVSGLILGLLQIILFEFFHSSIWSFVYIMSSIWIINLAISIELHLFLKDVKIIENNVADLFGLFTKLRIFKANKKRRNLRVLIFNWRDTKHIWAGGAEVYIHELAKRWVAKGYQVTQFCGNDSKSPRNEVIDGVQIYRRGGFYMVYVWAFLYYCFKFKGKFDVVIDSENGIPFFTPLFAREKTLLLIHHIHQEVFLTDLKFPLSQIGKFLEGVLMPLIYKNTKIITVSPSSKKAIESLGLGKKEEISIISPGVDLGKFQTNIRKTSKPSLLYLGRLKPYKSLDRFINIMVKIKEQVPGVSLTIAGDGESRADLEALVQKLNLGRVVKFLGMVSDKTKVELFAKSWALVQPSRIEGWGITIIEANAAGTTVIASDVPGLRDSVNNPHSGLLVTWDNEEKWINATVSVLTDKKQRNHLEEVAKGWAKEFSWEVSAEKLSILIKENLKKGKN